MRSNFTHCWSETGDFETEDIFSYVIFIGQVDTGTVFGIK